VSPKAQPKNLRCGTLLFCLNFHTSVDSKNSVFGVKHDAPELPMHQNSLGTSPVHPRRRPIGRASPGTRAWARALHAACRRAPMRHPRKSRPQTCRHGAVPHLIYIIIFCNNLGGVIFRFCPARSAFPPAHQPVGVVLPAPARAPTAPGCIGVIHGRVRAAEGGPGRWIGSALHDVGDACPNNDRRPRRSTRTHDAANLSIISITNHMSSCIASRTA